MLSLPTYSMSQCQHTVKIFTEMMTQHKKNHRYFAFMFTVLLYIYKFFCQPSLTFVVEVEAYFPKAVRVVSETDGGFKMY